MLDDWLAEDAGRYAALTCGLAVSRQNGKNGILEIRELFGMVGRGEKILHTAHEVKTARKAFKRLQHFFGRRVDDPAARFPELNALVVELRNVNGQEAIILANGGSVEIVARSQGSGRGFTVDVLVVDEAQDCSDDDLEALMPATSSAPLGNPQWIFTGTPPGPRSNGEVFTRTRTDALGDKPGRMTWAEWSLDADTLDGIDLDDHALWFDTNPALGTRLQVDVIEGERARFSDSGFARERLGWWRPGGTDATVLDLPLWMAEADPSAVQPPVEACTFALAVAPDRSWSAIGAAWRRPDGRTQLALVDYRRGAAWVPAAVAEIGCEPLLDMASRGVVKGVEMSPQQQAQAHNTIVDAHLAGEIRHDDQLALNIAARSLAWRAFGETRVLDRKNSADVCPFIAVAHAAWGARRAGDREPFLIVT